MIANIISSKENDHSNHSSHYGNWGTSNIKWTRKIV